MVLLEATLSCISSLQYWATDHHLFIIDFNGNNMHCQLADLVKLYGSSPVGPVAVSRLNGCFNGSDQLMGHPAVTFLICLQHKNNDLGLVLSGHRFKVNMSDCASQSSQAAQASPARPRPIQFSPVQSNLM